MWEIVAKAGNWIGNNWFWLGPVVFSFVPPPQTWPAKFQQFAEAQAAKGKGGQ